MADSGRVTYIGLRLPRRADHGAGPACAAAATPPPARTSGSAPLRAAAARVPRRRAEGRGQLRCGQPGRGACATSPRALQAVGLPGVRIGVIRGDDVRDLVARPRLRAARARHDRAAPSATGSSRPTPTSAPSRSSTACARTRRSCSAAGWPTPRCSSARSATSSAGRSTTGTASATRRWSATCSSAACTRPAATSRTRPTAWSPTRTTSGFPLAEVSRTARCVTKLDGTGGAVDERTMKTQLYYEIHDPRDLPHPRRDRRLLAASGSRTSAATGSGCPGRTGRERPGHAQGARRRGPGVEGDRRDVLRRPRLRRTRPPRRGDRAARASTSSSTPDRRAPHRPAGHGLAVRRPDAGRLPERGAAADGRAHRVLEGWPATAAHEIELLYFGPAGGGGVVTSRRAGARRHPCLRPARAGHRSTTEVVTS